MTSGGALVLTQQKLQNEETESSLFTVSRAKTMSEFVVNVKQERRMETQLLSGIKCEINDDYNSHHENILASIKHEVSVKLEDTTHAQIPTAPDEVTIKEYKKDPSEVKTKYTCSCNRVFYDKFQHFRHMLDHTIENMTSVKCYICDRYFKTRNGMIAHAYSKHIGLKCKFCTQKFPTKNSMMRHMEIHHCYFIPRQKKYTTKTHNRLKQMWIKKYRQNDYQMSPSSNVIKHSSYKKTKPTYNNAEFGRLSNIKTVPDWLISNVKTEPTFSNIKTEPIYPNVKIEPTDYSNVKAEPRYNSNVNIEPTYSNVKVEPMSCYYSNVNVEPTYSNVKVEPRSYYSNVNGKPTYSNVKVEPMSCYYSNVNAEPTYSNVKVEPSYYY